MREDLAAQSEHSREAGGGDATPESVNAGRWDFVIGLVGKPSAGKSTFFNAVTITKSDEQKVRV